MKRYMSQLVFFYGRWLRKELDSTKGFGLVRCLLWMRANRVELLISFNSAFMIPTSQLRDISLSRFHKDERLCRYLEPNYSRIDQ